MAPSGKVANVTITSTAGPGLTATAIVFNNIISISFNIYENTICIVDENNNPNYFAYNAVATVTYTISGNTATITIS